MKKIICILLALILFQSIPILSFADEVCVFIDGEQILFDTPPQILEGRCMVPVRGVFENLGAQVNYDEASKKVTVSRGETEIELVPGFKAAIVSGKVKSIDVPPVILNGRCLVPLRFISENAGLEITYSDAEKRIDVESGGEKVPSIPIVNVTAKKHDGNLPERAADGNYDTRWSADGRDVWIIFELEKESVAGYAGIAWYDGNVRLANFDLYTSLDGENWTKRFSGQQSELNLNMTAYDLGGEMCKYVKLVGNGNSSNEWNSITEFKVYPPSSDGKMYVEDAGLSGGSTEEMMPEPPKKIKDALLQFDNLMAKDTLQWLIDIYDPETGGFYYTKSGAQNEGFLPDAEATYGALDLIAGGGIFDEGIPGWWKEKLGPWVQNLQSDEDGYFYHPQWGKTTGSRRDRDYSYSTGILTRVGYEPLYKLAAERIAEATEGKEEEVAENVIAAVPDYLKSEAAFIKYLDSLDWSTAGIWSTGNGLASGQSAIAAAGLKDVLLDYVIEKQDKETGLWGGELDWNNINGAMKLATLFSAKRPYPNVDKLLDSIIHIMENVPLPKDFTAAALYNSSSALASAIGTQKELSQDFIDILFEKGPKYIEFLYQNCLKYKKEDGGFSSYTDRGLSQIQGAATVGFGGAESDMDGTKIISQSVRAALYKLFGLTPDKTLYKEYKDWFLESIQSKEPIVKMGKQNTFDFEDETLNQPPAGWSVSGDIAYVVNDPNNPLKNKCLRIRKSKAGTSASANVKIPTKEEYETLIFTCDILFENTGSVDFFYNTLSSSKGYCGVQWLIKGGNQFGYRSAGNVVGSSVGKGLNSNEWYEYKIEFIPKGVDDSVVKYYVDGKLIGETNTIYRGSVGNYTEVNKGTIDTLYFTAYLQGVGTFYIDNIKIDHK